MGGREMKKYKHTNKNEIPVPKYKVGQIVFIEIGWLSKYSIVRTTIRKVLPPEWRDYDNEPHWEISYRHQTEYNDRMVQYPIYEEDIYETEEEALRVMVEKFKEDTISQVIQFKKQFRNLGIANINLIELKQ